VSFRRLDEQALFEFCVYKDLVKGFPQVIPVELIQVTERLQKEETERLND
jgi:hypothetical protein